VFIRHGLVNPPDASRAPRGSSLARTAWLGVLLLAACRRPLVERDPGALIAVRTRAPQGAALGQVTVVVDGRAAVRCGPPTCR
jgi:hypothetical protein